MGGQHIGNKHTLFVLNIYETPKKLGRRWEDIQFDLRKIPSLKLTWHLKMMVSNRNLLFQGFIFRFHVCFLGCIPFSWAIPTSWLHPNLAFHAPCASSELFAQLDAVAGGCGSWIHWRAVYLWCVRHSLLRFPWDSKKTIKTMGVNII